MAPLKRPLRIENSGSLKGYGGGIDASICVLLLRRKKRRGGGAVRDTDHLSQLNLTS